MGERSRDLVNQLHGSLPNRSDRPRKSVLRQLYAGTDQVLHNEQVRHGNAQLVLSRRNHHMTRTLAAK